MIGRCSISSSRAPMPCSVSSAFSPCTQHSALVVSILVWPQSITSLPRQKHQLLDMSTQLQNTQYFAHTHTHTEDLHMQNSRAQGKLSDTQIFLTGTHVPNVQLSTNNRMCTSGINMQLSWGPTAGATPCIQASAICTHMAVKTQVHMSKTTGVSDVRTHTHTHTHKHTRGNHKHGGCERADL